MVAAHASPASRSEAYRRDRRRAVITGCGVVSPIGTSTASFWDALLAGESGVAPITRFDADQLAVRIAGDVTDFDPHDYLPPKVSRRLDRFAQFAVGAAAQAMEEAKLELNQALAPRVGVLIGSGYGAGALIQSATRLLDGAGAGRVSPFLAAVGATDSAACQVAQRIGAEGPSGAVATACASGTSAVGEALRMIERGTVDVVVAGGADDSITALDIAAAASARALSRRNDEPARASRPFDRDRDGFVMAAGAGVVVMEAAEHAQARGATILAEVAGYGATTDTHHITAPHPEGLGAYRAMQLALADAETTAAAVDYISAHGTSTVLNDAIESRAVRELLGDRAPQVPISSVKSMTGHMIGAAGAVELIATVLAIRHGIVPPTINCDHPEDPDLDYVAWRPKRHRVRTALSNSFGFGGHNAVLVVRDWPLESDLNGARQ